MESSYRRRGVSKKAMNSLMWAAIVILLVISVYLYGSDFLKKIVWLAPCGYLFSLLYHKAKPKK